MPSKTNLPGRDVYIVDGCRTPFLKARGVPGPFSAADLGVAAAKTLLSRQPFMPSDIDEVISGCIIPSPDEANISRIISLRVGCGVTTPAWTVQRNCATGMQALDNAAQNIAQGRSDLILVGGTEAMSRAPILYNRQMTEWFGRWFFAKTLGQRLKLITKLRPSFFAPVISLLQGLSDPLIGLSMGQTTENLATRFNISRTQMDEFSVTSHQRLAAAYDQNEMSEVIPLYDNQGQCYLQDDGLRRDSSVERLAKLKPVFEKRFGRVTAGNSSQVTDGSAYLILASADTVAKYDLPVLARILDVQWAGVDPAQMGLGPVHAATPILQRHNLSLTDIDYWEINEAFAGQVLACLSAWQDDAYCQELLGLKGALGALDLSRLNIDGGAVAIGHPIGVSGARLVLHLVNILQRKQANLAMATICIGGGQGGAMLLERVDKV
ncbi:MAG: acetyl-CoA C-acetyltransferase [Gammaproteobacteria bacterium]